MIGVCLFEAAKSNGGRLPTFRNEDDWIPVVRPMLIADEAEVTVLFHCPARARRTGESINSQSSDYAVNTKVSGMTLKDLEQENPILLYDKGYWYSYGDGTARIVLYGRYYTGRDYAGGGVK
jgi:hypothetical protein